MATANMNRASMPVLTVLLCLSLARTSYHLIYSTLSAIIMTKAAELEKTCMLAPIMYDSSNGSVEKRRTSPIRRMNMNVMAVRSHCICMESIPGPSASVFLGWRSLVANQMAHPRTSVVKAEASALDAGLVPIIGCRRSAPIWPRKYPVTFAMITQAAAYSMLIHLFMQMSSTMAIVSTVRRSSSLSPEYLHTRVTIAWSSANK